MLGKRKGIYDSSLPRPYNRSRLRTALGSFYFTWKRYITEYKNNARYAHIRHISDKLPYISIEHRTPLLRHLRNVDMQLQYNKIINLKLAAGRINGIILSPGESFSFWRLVGKPTRRKGYLEGMILSNGSFYPGVGGGLCQLSNLIYWMTLHTPLTVTERWRHSHDVFPDSDRTQPFGSGATISYNYVDLQIRNDTDADYQLRVWVGDTCLHGEWRCDRPAQVRYEVYEAEHSITHGWWGGYIRNNVLRRRTLDLDGNCIDDEFIVENHGIMMYEPLLTHAEDAGNT